MKKIVLLLVSLVGMITLSGAQDAMETVMEGRARELYRVLGLTDKAQYRKFMQENYTKTFLEKPVKMNRVVSDSDGNNSSATQEDKSKDVLEAKTQMYGRLHDDFGGSKMVSLKQKDNKVDMVLRSTSGLTGTFIFTFENSKPYLIDGMGVQAEMEN